MSSLELLLLFTAAWGFHGAGSVRIVNVLFALFHLLTQTMQESTLLYNLYFLHCFMKPNHDPILLEY